MWDISPEGFSLTSSSRCLIRFFKASISLSLSGILLLIFSISALLALISSLFWNKIEVRYFGFKQSSIDSYSLWSFIWNFFKTVTLISEFLTFLSMLSIEFSYLALTSPTYSTFRNWQKYLMQLYSPYHFFNGCQLGLDVIHNFSIFQSWLFEFIS